jgi:hypothetical protein
MWWGLSHNAQGRREQKHQIDELTDMKKIKFIGFDQREQETN